MATDTARDQHGRIIPGEEKVAHITAEHIAHGVRLHCEKCPLALAAAPLFPGRTAVITCNDVYVYGESVEIKSGMVLGGVVEEYWGHDGESFIDAFDTEQDVEPRDVHLRLVQRYS